MPSLAELMGQEVYDLIYTYYDSDGSKIDDRDDIFYCEDADIELSRIEPLKKLLIPISNARESLIPIEAARLLAAWGVEEAVDYFKYCIDTRIDRFGNLEPHRLHGYDTTYEEMTESLLHYQARCGDRSLAKEGFISIKPLISSILDIANEIPYDMLFLLPTVRSENWRVFESQLKDSFIIAIKKNEKYRNDYWNIIYLKLLFQEWDPCFLSEIESQYGVIEVPDTAQNLF